MPVQCISHPSRDPAAVPRVKILECWGKLRNTSPICWSHLTSYLSSHTIETSALQFSRSRLTYLSMKCIVSALFVVLVCLLLRLVEQLRLHRLFRHLLLKLLPALLKLPAINAEQFLYKRVLLFPYIKFGHFFKRYRRPFV